jgi:hypothetical protein
MPTDEELDYYKGRAGRAEKHAAAQSRVLIDSEAKRERLAACVIGFYRETSKGSFRLFARRIVQMLQRSIVPRLLFFKSDQRAFLKERRNIAIIARSSLFDAEWYLRNNPSVRYSRMDLAEHYYREGWREGRNPSSYFSNEEYHSLNPDVKEAGLCPLYHYEHRGKYEGRFYSRTQTAQWHPRSFQERYRLLDCEREKKKFLHSAIKRGQDIPIQANKIVFRTYQGDYVCNPKYICEELLKRDVGYDIVWLFGSSASKEDFPKQLRTVSIGSQEAEEEVASAKLLIDNGVHMFRDARLKKEGQVSVCTWHGSLGFKRLDTVVNNAHDGRSLELYRIIHDYLISNSAFEEEVYQTSYWPESEMLRLGHARNDVLFLHGVDADAVLRMQKKVRLRYGIPQSKKIALYAPTFRWNPVSARPRFPLRRQRRNW